jgi:4-diphosphocytidyl-2-C-methyl-D-erythritol kinase
MTLRSYAKINLGLRVLNRREDGYHNIETVFHRINLYDEISFELSRKITLITDKSGIPADHHNLCVKAALALQRQFAPESGAEIRLNKKIPVGAGLGGGSSNAATTLLALNNLWNLQLSDNNLEELALQIGSDVPFFLRTGSAYAKGRGEILEYFHLDIPYWIVLVYPSVHISTAWAYANLVKRNHENQPTLKEIIFQHLDDTEMLANHLKNDFEPLALSKYPILARMREILKTAGANYVQMSGSGSSMFAFFSDEQAAKDIVKKMENQYPVFLTSPNFQPEE